MWFQIFNKNKRSLEEHRKLISIRLEAIGGQGANSAGKIIAEAAVLGMHFTGNHFSSFGSEKRGTPVRSFVRFSPGKQTIRSASFISKPDLVVVFHESLLKKHLEIFDGVHAQTDLIVNTHLKPDQISVPEGCQFRRIMTLDATSIANNNECGLNAVMLGACSMFLNEIDSEVLEKTLLKFFSRLPEKIQKNNQNGFQQGMSKFNECRFEKSQATAEKQTQTLPMMGYLNAPIGGTIINPGNSVLKDNSASRKGVAPKFLKEICFNCGLCDMICPDYCFVWEKKENSAPTLLGIDYQYCKGCQKCVVACPVEALIPTLEKEIPEEQKKLHVFPQADKDLIRQKWTHADWSQVVSELSNESRMLTLQTELLDTKSYLRPNLINNSETTSATAPTTENKKGDI